MNITILVDTVDSWMHPWAKELGSRLVHLGYNVSHASSANEIKEGDISFLLGCVKLVPPDILKRNKYNMVVHPSDLPKGKGFSPVAWQVLEGKKEIPVVMFDAVPEVDGGNIFLCDTIKLNGSELNEEIKRKQGIVTFLMCLKFIETIDEIIPIEQSGEESFYKRRTKEDSELDPNKTVAEQFSLLRVVDNERYPAFFYLNDVKYILHISKA